MDVHVYPRAEMAAVNFAAFPDDAHDKQVHGRGVKV